MISQQNVFGPMAIATVLVLGGAPAATAQQRTGTVVHPPDYFDSVLASENPDRLIRVQSETVPPEGAPQWSYAPWAPKCDTVTPPGAELSPLEPTDPAQTPSPQPTTPQPPAAGFQPGGLQGGTLLASGNVAAQSNVGYIDMAIPVTMFRLRYDAAWDNEFPDRAEFFYAQCGCSSGPGPGDPNIPTVNDTVDYQEIRATFEYAWNNRFSVFAELPMRFIDPELENPAANGGAIVIGPGSRPTGNTGGLGDVEAGFKYALLATPEQYFTFQFRTYAPSGDASRGLGTHHVSLEPGLLYFNRLTDDLTLESELRYWIPVGGTDFAGDVLRYGVGLGYNIYETSNFRLSPVVEFVGWSVLDGKMTDLSPEAVAAGGARSARTTIVNGKFGVRMGWGPQSNVRLQNQQVYVGYGRALTGQHWYEDILRLEYRILF